MPLTTEPYTLLQILKERRKEPCLGYTVVLADHPGNGNWKTVGPVTVEFKRGLALEVIKSGLPEGEKQMLLSREMVRTSGEEGHGLVCAGVKEEP